MAWDIPTLSGTPFSLSLSPGESAVFVGANGTGKSALSHWLHKQVPENVPTVRLLAHRRLWLSSSGPETTASYFTNISTTLSYEDREPTSRYRDVRGDDRTAGLLFRLMSAENERNSRVAKLVDGGSIPEKPESSPLLRISCLLQAVGLELTFHIGPNMSFAVQKDGHQYPIEQMSDGEKAGFLLAAEVVLADEGTVIILDEPERHLHRSISGSLVGQMVTDRPDCGFVVFTHDLYLVDRLRHESAHTMIVRAVAWNEPNVSGWDLEELPTQAPIPEEARHAVLGGRDRILFVEGTPASLDSSLYELLFPGWSIQSVGSCREIIQMVSSLRRAAELHWITAAGIVDGDARTSAETEKLKEQGILALPVNEVESLYFLPEVIQAMAKWQERQLSSSAETLFDDALRAGVAKIASLEVQSNLAAANAEKILHRRIQSELPSRSEIPNTGASLNLTVDSPYQDQLDALEKAVNASNWEVLVTAYSVRDSPALDAISKALKYPNRAIYQQAVLGRLRDDATLLKSLRAKLPSLPLPPSQSIP
ncbi:AAA family ATPase [Brevibacterium oceani]|uniref:AAA family ATPase n=1 Tax=Brevibacterium oceani TaxID=358099 RepID=UPI001B31A854|nr:AAA family ATPase [Brevibacterium oceani]